MNANMSSQKPFKIVARAKFSRFNDRTFKTTYKSKSWDITNKRLIEIADYEKFVMSVMDHSTPKVVKINSVAVCSEYSDFYDIIVWIAKTFEISLPLAMSISHFCIDLPGVRLVILSKDNFTTDKNETKYTVVYDYGLKTN